MSVSGEIVKKKKLESQRRSRMRNPDVYFNTRLRAAVHLLERNGFTVTNTGGRDISPVQPRERRHITPNQTKNMAMIDKPMPLEEVVKNLDVLAENARTTIMVSRDDLPPYAYTVARTLKSALVTLEKMKGEKNG